MKKKNIVSVKFKISISKHVRDEISDKLSSIVGLCVAKKLKIEYVHVSRARLNRFISFHTFETLRVNVPFLIQIF